MTSLELTFSENSTKSLEPFRRVVKLAARAFYDDMPLNGENQPKNGRSDNRGMAVVILDALTNEEWVREEELASKLKMHHKQLRRILRFFEEEKFVTKEVQKQTAKSKQKVNAEKEGGEEKKKLHMYSYWCIDYAQICDVVNYRLNEMRKKLKDGIEFRETVQEYVCPGCKRRYNAFDALQLISPTGDCFHCENCNGELVAESNKLTTADEMGGGDHNARKRREKLKEMLQRMEKQLDPLKEQLKRVKDLPCPEYGPLQAWQARNGVAHRAENGDTNGNDPSMSSYGYDGTALRNIDIDMVKDEDIKTEAKVVPPWMIKQGMNLTKEQLGEVTTEAIYGKPTSADLPEDIKPKVGEEEEDITAYYEAYYEALGKRQQEQHEAAKMDQDMPSDRQVGMKFKHEEEDDIEWEDAPIPGTATETYEPNNMNASVEKPEDDDIDWEDG